MITRRDNIWEEKKISMDPGATIFTAETTAVVEALKVYKDFGEERRLLIYTDSASVLKVIESTKNKSASDIKNTNRPEIIIKILNELSEIYSLKNIPVDEKVDRKRTPVIFVWVPAHRGIVGNEKADAAAKSATEMQPNPEYCIPHEDIVVELVDGEWKDFAASIKK